MKKQAILDLIKIFGLYVICDSWNDDSYLKIHWDKSANCAYSINYLIISKHFDNTEEKICKELRGYLMRKGEYDFKLKVIKAIGNIFPELTYRDKKEMFD